jgi:hypothetical protein
MSDGQIKSHRVLLRAAPFRSIRARLILLALLAVAPLMLERVHGLETARAERTDRAHAEVVDLAKRGVRAKQEIIGSVRALLQIEARAYGKLPVDPSNCSHYLTDLTGNVPWVRSLAVAGTDGRIKCSADPAAIGLNVSDRPRIQRGCTRAISRSATI